MNKVTFLLVENNKSSVKKFYGRNVNINEVIVLQKVPFCNFRSSFRYIFIFLCF